MKPFDRLFPVFQLVIVVWAWSLAFPQLALWEGVTACVLASLALLLSGDSVRWEPRLLTRIAALGLTVGGTFYIRDLAAGRIPAIWFFILVFAWFCGKAFRKHQYDLVFLILTIGLGAAPFTELHLERNIWTLSAFFLFWCETLSSRNLRFTHLQIASILCFILFIFAAAAGIHTSIYPYSTLRFTGILLFDLLVYIGVIHTFSDGARRRNLLFFLLTLFAMYPLFALFAALTRTWFLGPDAGLHFRLFVFDRHPNYVIMPILLSLPLWIRYLPRSGGNWRIRSGAALSVFLSLGYILFFSYSRQGWIQIILYGVILLPFLLRKISPRLLLTSLVLFAGSFATAALKWKTLYYRIISLPDLAFNHRYQAWKVFWELIKEHPWFGYGLGTNRYIYPQAFGLAKPTLVPTRQFLFEAHNAYIDILTGMGLVGLSIFLIFLLVSTRPFRLPRRFDDACWFALGTGVWMDLVFNFRFHAQDTGVLLMIILAMIAAREAGKGNKPPKLVNIGGMISKPVRFLVVTLILVFAGLPWMGKIWVQESLDLLKTKDWKTIRSFFNRAALIEPLNAHPHYYLSLCAQQMNEPDQAVRELERAVMLNPNYGFYRYNLAVQHADMGNLEKTREQLLAAKTLEPYDQDAKYRFMCGLVNRKLGFLDEAREDFFYSLLLNPDLVKDEYWEGNPLLFRELIKDFIEYGHKLIYLGPETYHQANLVPVARVFQTAGLLDRTEKFYQSAIHLYPLNSDLFIRAALFFMDREDNDQAESILFRGLVHINDFADYMNMLGYLYLKQGRREPAEHLFLKAQTNWRHLSLDNLFGYKMQARLFQESGQDSRLREVTGKIRYLESGIFQSQYRDQSIHNGPNTMGIYEMTSGGSVN